MRAMMGEWDLAEKEGRELPDDSPEEQLEVKKRQAWTGHSACRQFICVNPFAADKRRAENEVLEVMEARGDARKERELVKRICTRKNLPRRFEVLDLCLLPTCPAT